MADYEQPPNMGANFSSLAQLAQPQMMPNTPLGAPSALYQYNQDKSRQDSFIQQAASLAQQDAAMRASAADEYGRGAPGRNATIDTNNQMAMGKQGSLPDLLSAQSDTAKAGAIKASAAKQAAEQEKLEPWATKAFQKGANISDIIDDMKSSGITKIGARDIDSVPPEKIQELLKNIHLSQVNSVSQSQKEQLETMKEVAAQERETTRAKAKIEAAGIAAKMRETIAKTNAENRPPDPTRVIFQEIEKKLGLRAATDWYEDEKIRVATAAAGSKQDVMHIDKGTLAGTGVTTSTPPAPASSPLPPGMGSPSPGAVQPRGPATPPPPRVASKAEALQILEGMKGTPQYESAKSYYKATYNEDPPK